MLELIVNQNENEETICLVENGRLVEKYQNNENTIINRLEGNIYAGKVVDIVPGMQACFVDYGLQKNGLLHLRDAVPQINTANNKQNDLSSMKISDVVKKDQKILVQIKKDSNDKKGAKTSTHITIPSKYVVLMPNTDIVTISQKISDEKKKNELLKLVNAKLPKNIGVILRTCAIDATNEQVEKDIDRCIKKWENITNNFKKSKECSLIYESESVQAKILIDVKVDKVITNNKNEFEKLKKLIEFEELKGVKLEYSPKKDLLDLYDLNNQIEKLSGRKFWLNCGGFITIDKTEALTAIDVNTGKFTGKSDLESTVFKVNKEATHEIAKQLKLQDIGGIIIIDYIDMVNENNKKKIVDLLKEELKHDRAKTQVEGFTKLNLMELTRKHICSHLDL